MSNMTNNPSRSFSKIPPWLSATGPLILLGLLVIFFLNNNPIQLSSTNLPPIEELSFQNIRLQPGVINLSVINSGPDKIDIAQIIIDEAYWNYEVVGKTSLSRFESTQIVINYPWVETEPFEIVIITSSGTTFAHEVELAIESPQSGSSQFLAYGLIGLYVGIIPVGLGLLWYPTMRKMSRMGLNFALSLTIGLLVFLIIDTFLESVEISALVPGVLQGLPLSLFTALLTWLSITAVGNSNKVKDRNSPSGRKFIALLISIGIGFHNLGEGLVVGAAFAFGEAALGSFLVIGFILHNITEGIGIIAPVTKDKLPVRWFLAMLLIAGGPAVLGTLIGGFAFSPLLAVIFLGIGIGAIWQVIYEVSMLIQRDAIKHSESMVSWVNVFGLAVGISIMYLTAFLVKF